jgi:hypothetical protein
MTEGNTPRTLGETSHTNPHTGEVFGETQTYRRGRTVAADGGTEEPAADDEAPATTEVEPEDDPAADGPGDRLRDVDHRPPAGAVSADGVYRRGEKRSGDGV